MNNHLAAVPKGMHTRWASFENPKGAKGAGGKENFAAKGRPFRHIARDETVTLLECTGAGQVNRMWMTFRVRAAAALPRRPRHPHTWSGSRGGDPEASCGPGSPSLRVLLE